MQVFYSDVPPVALPDGHRFPMPKYSRLHQRVRSDPPPRVTLVASEPAGDAQLCLVHDPEYVRRVMQGELTEKETRRIGFPWSPELTVRSRHSVGGTLGACRAALRDGLALHLAGGTHHAYPEHGEGYCVFNDVAVAARAMQQERRARRCVVIDLDVHQGNGTAAIFAGDPSVFTFSVHGQKNFPFHKELSSLDIALPDASGDAEFLAAVRQGLPQALAWALAGEQVLGGPGVGEAGLDRAPAGSEGFEHDCLGIYIAGADPYIEDRLGRLAMSKEGLAERDRCVIAACRQAGLPLAIVMGGGYAKNVDDVIDIHYRTLQIAATFSSPPRMDS
ncbi:MAG: histone deacetylase [Chloroflexota bacterium]